MIHEVLGGIVEVLREAGFDGAYIATARNGEEFVEANDSVEVWLMKTRGRLVAYVSLAYRISHMIDLQEPEFCELLVAAVKHRIENPHSWGML